MADQVADLPPEMAILDSYFESSDVADQVADIPPKMAIFHSYFIDFYLQSSHGQIYPPEMAILHSYL